MPEAVNRVHREMQKDQIKTHDIWDVQKPELRKEERAEHRAAVWVAKGPSTIDPQRNAKVEYLSQHAHKKHPKEPEIDRQPQKNSIASPQNRKKKVQSGD